MSGGPASRRSSVDRRGALAGLAGAALAAVGDVLILGRAVSGADFDRAVGVVPSHVAATDRWRSLWNGAVLSRRRVQVGTLSGVIGIGVLAATGMRGALRQLEPGGLRRLAATSVVTFAASGALTHLSCGAVILEHQRTLETDPAGPRATAPGSATALLAVSAATSLTALAVFSAGLGLAALRGSGRGPTAWCAATAFPCVLATLLTFGRLPAPVGGYARPASISTGLIGYFCVAAVVADRLTDRSGPDGGACLAVTEE